MSDFPSGIFWSKKFCMTCKVVAIPSHPFAILKATSLHTLRRLTWLG